ncbi:hypothetical protein K3H42_02830 [Aeromonas veronii]|uniref:hypothetical protein n=1 Tax=Aeromonas veronii TaxID=654 RepID=UPI001F47AAED|nr:hypothetical protein [Aeromonas veronii]MCF5894056.1 hypothetical protein [Aeromonas veronii]
MKILEQQDAIDLWLKGKDIWNQWISKNPHIDINFSRINFSELKQHKNNTISFKGYQFPKFGRLSFYKADFGKLNVDFSNCQFGHANLIFRDAIFNGGDVDFTEAVFNSKNISFKGAKFGDGNIKFSKCEFLDSKIIFRIACFGKGIKSFKGCIFDNCSIEFYKTDFGSGETYFTGNEFNDCENLSFCGAKFGGNLVLTQSFIDVEILDFRGTKFDAHINLQKLNLTSKIKHILFRYAVFGGSAEFSTRNELNIIPDFIGTKISNHFNISQLRCNLKRDGFIIFKKSTNKLDAERLCRLKEISEGNKDYSMALRFHAEEMRAKRWNQTGLMASILDLLFDISSNYGQSIIRPCIGFLFFFIGLLVYTINYPMPNFMWIHLAIATSLIMICFKVNARITLRFFFAFIILYGALNHTELKNWEIKRASISLNTWVYGTDIVVAKVLPFVGGTRELGKNAVEKLNCSIPSDNCQKVSLPVHYGLISTILFSMPSFIFIFLIGLGLRNRFRI